MRETTSFIVSFLISFLLLSSTASAQVKINEKVEIKPQSAQHLPNGIISGDDRNPIYLGYGGTVTLLPFNSIHLSGLELWEESLGKIVDASNGADSILLGSFEQWHQLIFYIKDVSTGEKYYPELTTERMGETDELVQFYPSHIQGDPYPPNPEYAWIMHLQINPSLASMPPQEILDYYGNPFTPSSEINIPINGQAYVIIKKVENTGINLFTDMPTEEQIASNIKEAVNDTIWLGEKLAGSNLRFYIKSPNALLNGASLYADNVSGVSQTDEGELLLGRLNFEDGTDELFDDEQVEIYLHPDDVGDFPSPVSVVFSKTELAPGDTAQIEIKHRNDDGTIGDFPQDQYFDIEIIKNMDYGTLYSSYENQKSYYFFSPGSFSFIAKDSIDVDSIKAIVRVGTYFGDISYSKPIKNIERQKTQEIDETTQKIIRKTHIEEYKIQKQKKIDNIDKGKENTIVPNATVPGGNYIIGFGEVLIKKENKDSIMLGETKYYQAKYNSQEKKLKIEEIKPDANGIPQQKTGTVDGWEWLTTDVWGTNPVSIDTGKNYGKKMGVYWEKEKPVWDGNTNKGNLAEGLIRLVGRYWSKDSTYIIKLKAKRNNDSSEVKIKVVKPGKLLSSQQIYQYNKYMDIDSSEINIDTLCISEGGKYGLPPHILKGQIFQETAKINRIFYPSYRYEPYTTQWNKYLQTWSGRFYFQDSMSVDYSDIPNHNNVEYMVYIREVKTVWDIIKEYSQLVNSQNSSEYGKRNDDHSMNFNKKYFPGIQNQYDSFLKGYKMNVKLTNLQAADSANKRMVKWFQDTWKNGKAAKTIAQTRCASSYGLLQMLYTTARERGYSKSSLPENLNEINLFDNWLKYQVSLLYKNLTSENNWAQGFEKTYKVNILANWNSASTYPGTVISNSQKFLPQNK